MDQTTQTSPAGQGPTTALPQLPQFPSGQEVYDAIMGQIEPELTSAVLSTLDEKYQSETPEQKQQRQARYDVAFDEYNKRFTQFSVELATHVHTFQRTAVAAAEMSTKAEESEDLSSLESSMQSA